MDTTAFLTENDVHNSRSYAVEKLYEYFAAMVIILQSVNIDKVYCLRTYINPARWIHIQCNLSEILDTYNLKNFKFENFKTRQKVATCQNANCIVRCFSQAYPEIIATSPSRRVRTQTILNGISNFESTSERKVLHFLGIQESGRLFTPSGRYNNGEKCAPAILIASDKKNRRKKNKLQWTSAV